MALGKTQERRLRGADGIGAYMDVVIWRLREGTIAESAPLRAEETMEAPRMKPLRKGKRLKISRWGDGLLGDSPILMQLSMRFLGDVVFSATTRRLSHLE